MTGSTPLWSTHTAIAAVRCPGRGGGGDGLGGRGGFATRGPDHMKTQDTRAHKWTGRGVFSPPLNTGNDFRLLVF